MTWVRQVAAAVVVVILQAFNRTVVPGMEPINSLFSLSAQCRLNSALSFFPLEKKTVLRTERPLSKFGKNERR
jgi:hypothetical protein